MRGATVKALLTAAAIAAVLAQSGGISAMEEKKTAEERLAVYAPVEISVPWHLLDENETLALEKVYRAAEVMDELFLRQVWSGNVRMAEKIEELGDPALMRLFRINFGPWDRIEENEPFVGEIPKPAGAEFYPHDMTREEFEKHLQANPGAREAFESEYTVIRRSATGDLAAIPYSTWHRPLLELAAGYLEEAAALTSNESLAAFLKARAEAFLSNDYFESDMAWMDVTGNVIDVTIGPYEVYEDNLFNYKAAFEAFVCIRDPEESRRLDGLKGYLLKLEDNLPIPDEHKSLDRGTESPISVVDEVFSAGDTKAGVQTLAFNLPNDRRVHEAKGSKKVMLRNIIRAKFDKILIPIAERVIVEGQLAHVKFDAYYNHILLHEFSHGLGPGVITLADGTETTARKALREVHSAIEEAKADIVGNHNIYYLVDEGFFGENLEKEAAVTFLAGFFRSVRFGAESAHGRANMVIFNYMKERGVYRRDQETGRWSVDFDGVRKAVEDLSAKILMIQAEGDYDAAVALLEQYGVMGEDVRESLAALEGVPVDIYPIFEIQEAYAAE